MKKLKNLYVSGLYKLSMWGAGLVNRAMLHLIELNGLDPNSDPEQLRHLRFQEDLNQAVDPRRFESGSKRAYAKISVPVKPGSKHDIPHDKAYKIKPIYPNAGVPDYSNADDNSHATEEAWAAWKAAPKRTLHASEVMERKHDKENIDYCVKTYTPVTESTQPPVAVTEFESVDQPSYCAEDLLVFEALDKAIQNAESEETVNNLKKAAVDIVKKKGQKSTKKTTKKPAKKSRKKA